MSNMSYCRWRFHRWRVVHDTGFTVYAECLDCKTRKVTQLPNGYQPINTDWLAGLVTNDRMRSNAKGKRRRCLPSAKQETN